MKGISILFIAVLLAVQGFSQEEANFRKFKFGFKVDPNISWMSPKTADMVNEGVLLRGSFGLNADIMFSENYALGTGFSIMGSGGQLSFFDTEVRTGDAGESNFIVKRNRKYKLKYVEVPLTLKLRTDEIGYMTYWGQFGVGLGFATKATADDDIKFFSQLVEDTTTGESSWLDAGSANSTIAKEDEEEMGVDISGETLPFRASLIIGAGIDYSLSGNTSLMFGIAYNNGLTNVFKSKTTAIETNDDDNPSYGIDSEVIGGRFYNEFKMKSITNSFVLTAGILF